MNNLSLLNNLNLMNKSGLRDRSFFQQFKSTDLGLSLRQLSAKETAVIRARRSIDNVEADFTEKDILNGTLLNWTVPASILALYNNKMWFDKVNDVVQFGDIPAFELNDFVIRVKGVVGNSGNVEYMACIQGDIAGGDLQGILIRKDSDNKISVLLKIPSSGSFFTLTSSTTYPVGSLVDIRIVKNGTNIELFINEISRASSSSAPATVDYSLTANPMTQLGAGWTGSGSSTYFTGVIYDFSIADGSDVVISSYLGYGVANSDWEDQVGGNDGTVVGTPALFTGQTFNAFIPRWYDQKVPSTRRKMYFADEENVLISNINLTGNFFIQQKFVIKDFSGTKGTLSDSSGSLESYGFSANNTFFYFIGATTYSITLDITLDINKEYLLRFERNSNVISVWIDGVLQTNTVAVPSTQFKVQFIGGFRKLVGTTWDININNVARYIGGGEKSSDWLDQIGTNHGSPQSTTGVGLASVSIDDWTTLSEDFIQPTAVSQPSIILDGAVNLSDGQPAILFDGVNYFIYSARRLAVNLSANDAQVAMVTEIKNPTSDSTYLMAEADVVSPYSSNFIFLATVGTANLWVNVTEFGTKTSGQHALAFKKTGGAGAGTRTFETFKNGAVDEVAKTATVNNDTFIVPYRTVIGGRADGVSTFFGGKIQEVIVARNTTNDIIKIQKNQMKYFAITA